MTVKTDYAPFEGITFDTTSVGEATATLDNSEWSTLSGIREGYIITTDSGNGKAVITRDVQFQSLSVPIKIIESPTGLSHAAGNWSLFVPETKKIGDYAPRHIKSSLILPEYWNSLQDIFIDEIFYYPYWKTSSSVTPKARAILKASSIDGTYLPCSRAIMVCRVQPALAASSSCVISPWSKRNRRRRLFILAVGMVHLPSVQQ